jgi:hypothetical protein
MPLPKPASVVRVFGTRGSTAFTASKKWTPQCQQQMGHAYHGWHYIVYGEAKGCWPPTQDASKCTNPDSLLLSVLMGGNSRKHNQGPMHCKSRSGLVVSQPKVSGRVVPGFHIDIDQCEQNFKCEFVNSQIWIRN